MGQARTLQSALNAGELSPRMRGRTDTPRYHNGLETCHNAITLITGGATRTPGTRHVAPAAALIVRQIEFHITINDNLTGFILEFSALKLRFMKSDKTQIKVNGVPVELVTPYTENELRQIEYEQFGDELYLVHGSHAPKKLTRTSDTVWTLADIVFTSQPADGRWTDANGWPRSITFWDQRMVLAGSAAYPKTVWASKNGDPLIFLVGTLDSDPAEWTPTVINTPIRHLATSDVILLFTDNCSASLEGGNDAALSPTNFLFKNRTHESCHRTARPLQVGGEVFFPSRSGKRFRVFRYKLDTNKYYAPDMAIYGEHLPIQGGGIVETAFAREPFSTIFAVTFNGHLIAFTYDPDQEVMAWHRHYTTDPDTFYQSLACTTDENGEDQIWLAVSRKINGVWLTHNEVMDQTLFTHDAITDTSDTAKSTWGNLGHLEGKTVDVLGDGSDLPPQLVTNGQITLPQPALAIEAGLNFTTIIKDLPPDLANPGTTAHGSNMKIDSIRVRLHQTKACKINGETVTFRKFGQGVLDKPIEAFSGDKEVLEQGWSKEPEDSQVTIIQDRPLPLTVLAIIKQVSANG